MRVETVFQDVDGGDEAANSFAKPKKSKKSKSLKKKSRSHGVSDGVDTPDSSAMVTEQAVHFNHCVFLLVVVCFLVRLLTDFSSYILSIDIMMSLHLLGNYPLFDLMQC